MDNISHLSITSTNSYYHHVTSPIQSHFQNNGEYLSNDTDESVIIHNRDGNGKIDKTYVECENENDVEIFHDLVDVDPKFLNREFENKVIKNINESFKTENIQLNNPTNSIVPLQNSNDSIDSNKANTPNKPPGVKRIKRRRGSCSYKNVYLCKFCDLAYIEEQKCQDHEILEHDPGTPFFCRQCGGLFAERKSLIRHYKHVHKNERAYQCMGCEKAFVRRAELRKHSIIHTGVAPFQCNFCLKSFTRNTNLSKHLRIHSGEKPHCCSICPRRFIFKADLQRHSLVHSKIKPYSCRICGRCYARKDKLVLHEGKHFEEENEENPSSEQDIALVNDSQENSVISEKNEDSKMTIDLHPLDVTDDKTLRSRKPKLLRDIICEHCPKKFYSMDMYMSHLTTHTGENNFICSICPKKFPHKWQLERHKIIHEDIKPLICIYCNKGFGRKDKLSSHIKIHTK